MQFFDLINSRHSIRSYQDREVEKEKIKKICQAAIKAPSAGNLQAYEIVVVKDSKRKKELSRAALGQEAVDKAPVVFVFFADSERSAVKYGQRGASFYSLQDATIACVYAQLAAHDLGLSCVWIGAFDDVSVCNILGAKKGLKPVAILPCGYPAEEPYKTPRRDFQEIVHFEKF